MSPKPKISVTTHSFGALRSAGKITIKESIEYAASLGVEGIDIVAEMTFPSDPFESAYELLEMRDTIKSHGMKVSCYSTYINNWITSTRKATLEDQIKQSLKQIGNAYVIGAKNYRPQLLPSFGYHRIGLGEEQITKKQWDDFANKEIKPLAMGVLSALKKYDIRWGTEIHDPIPPKLIVDLVKEINSPYVGLIPDFSCWEKTGEGKRSLEDYKICMPYVKHVHAKAHVFNKNGEEPNIPFEKLIPILVESGYDRYITAEFESLGTSIDPRIGVKTLVELIQRYL